MPPDSQSKLIVLVAIFGAIGGFLAWLLMATTGGSLFPGWSSYATVPTAVLFGAAAAGIGVYVLANTDMTNLGRGLFFALLCGIFFKPVMQAGYGFVVSAVSQAQARSSASTVQGASQTLASALKSSQPRQVTTQVQKTSDATTALVQQAAAVSDPELKQKLDSSSTAAIDTIASAAPAAPQASVNSLLQIGDAARKSGNTKVTLSVLSALKQIETNTQDGQSAIAAGKAAEALRSQ
jgi:hypothetical protein